MRAVRAVLLLLHIAGLTVGAFFAFQAALSVVDNFATDDIERAASRISVALALVSITLAFGAVLVSRGFTPIAPILFALSYVAVGMVVSLYTRGMAKHFAPFDPQPLDYAVAAAKIGAVCVIALLALVWTRRLSRFPLI